MNTLELLGRCTHLRDFITQFKSKENFFSKQTKHTDREFEPTHKHFLFSFKPLKIFFFSASILTIIVLIIPTVHTYHMENLKYQIGYVPVRIEYCIGFLTHEKNQISKDIISSCKLEWWIIYMSIISVRSGRGKS